jgi:hypothetical protein
MCLVSRLSSSSHSSTLIDVCETCDEILLSLSLFLFMFWFFFCEGEIRLEVKFVITQEVEKKYKSFLAFFCAWLVTAG